MLLDFPVFDDTGGYRTWGPGGNFSSIHTPVLRCEDQRPLPAGIHYDGPLHHIWINSLEMYAYAHPHVYMYI